MLIVMENIYNVVSRGRRDEHIRSADMTLKAVRVEVGKLSDRRSRCPDDRPVYP